METTKRITPEIVAELQTIQKFLETRHSDEPAVLSEVLAEVNVQMARSGFLLAEAKADLDAAMAVVFDENMKAIQKMPATVSTKFMSALCKEEQYNVNWIERINRTCVHAADNLRSLLSYAKESSRVGRYADAVAHNDFDEETADEW